MRTGSRRGARARLAWAAVLFLVGQFASALLLDYIWPDLRFPSLGGVMKHLHEHPSPQVVFLGSSRVGAGILAEEIEDLLRRVSPGPTRSCGVLNASIPSGDCITSEYVLRRLLRAGARPRLVVMEVMPEYFSRCNCWYDAHVGRQLCWEDLPEHLGEICRAGEIVRLLRGRFLPLYLHRKSVRDALLTAAGVERLAAKEKPAAPRSDGPIDWQGLLTPPPAVLTPETVAVMRRSGEPKRRLRRFSFGGNSQAAFERTLELCRQHDIRVLLMASAMTRQYRLGHPAEVNEAFDRYVQELPRRWPVGYIDCRDWLDDGLFGDVVHLTEAGGRYFSRLLTHRALEAWWRQECAAPLARRNGS